MIQRWFAQRTPRQQLLLVVPGAGVLSVLLVAAVLLPLHQSLGSLRATRAAEAAALAEVLALVGAHARLQEQVALDSSPLPLIARLNQSLERQAFQPQRIQQGRDGELQLRVEDVEFDALLGWLYELEQTPGVLLDAASMSRAGNGRISANLTLRSL